MALDHSRQGAFRTSRLIFVLKPSADLTPTCVRGATAAWARFGLADYGSLLRYGGVLEREHRACLSDFVEACTAVCPDCERVSGQHLVPEHEAATLRDRLTAV